MNAALCQPLRIVMISDAESGGGAALAATRLAKGFCARGHDVTLLVRVPDAKSNPWRTIALETPRSSLSSRIADKLLRPGYGRDARYRQTEATLHSLLLGLRPDVINVHNIHWDLGAGWGPNLVGTCASLASTVWTLHDMWSFTGRCAYSYDCTQFITGCNSSCPTPTEYPPLEPKLIEGSWKIRKSLFANHPNLTAVSPSAWLAQEARKGLWKSQRVEVIPNGIELRNFSPISRESARAALGIQAGSRVVLSAYAVKKRPEVVAALNRLPADTVHLVLFGRGPEWEIAPHIPVTNLGPITSVEGMANVYNASDAFLHPSRMDNFPNTLIESFACGTPAIAGPAGGIPELVHPNLTGWLAEDFSEESTHFALMDCIADIRSGRRLREECRELSETFTIERQASHYELLFASLLSQAVRSSATPALSGGR